MSPTFYLPFMLLASTAFSVVVQNADSPNKIPGSYIVMYHHGTLRNRTSSHEDRVHKTLKSKGQGGINRSYNMTNFKGYHVKTDKSGLQEIASSSLVATIIQDVKVSVNAPPPSSSSSIRSSSSSSSKKISTSNGAIKSSLKSSFSGRFSSSSIKSSYISSSARVSSSSRRISSSSAKVSSSSVKPTSSSVKLSSSSVKPSSSSPSPSSSRSPSGCAAGIAAATATSAPWNLARISRRVSSKSTSNQPYVYDKSSCTGTYVYIVDTGIYINHADFGGRATWGANFISGSADTDENGHGTHVSGTIGSSTYGICKAVNLIAVKVLDKNGSGSLSGVMAGMQWALKDAQSKGTVSKSVINLSLGGAASSDANSVFSAIVDQGMTVVVAAGNSNDDAKNYTPASARGVIAVAASDGSDTRASFSNYGTTVSIFAPGVGILSTWNSQGGTATLSGTSMAAPHIAGLSAYFIALGVTGPAKVLSKLQSVASPNLISNANGSPNLLAYNNDGC